MLLPWLHELMPNISSSCRQIWKEKVRYRCVNRVGDMLPDLYIRLESVRLLCDYIRIRKLSTAKKHGGLYPPGRVLARSCLENVCPHAFLGWYELGNITPDLPICYKLGRCPTLCWTVHEPFGLGCLLYVVHT